MKSQVKYVFLGLLIASSHLSAQTLNSSIDEKQITVGTWPCQVSTEGSGGQYSVSANAQYQKNGLSTHNDEVVFTATNGDSIKMNVVSKGRWRYEPSTQRMFESLNEANVTYDPKNSLANTVGAMYQRNYRDAIGIQQASHVVLLNDKQWIAVIGDSDKSMVKVNCQRS